MPHDKADFVALGLYERADLQRLLRDDISVVDADLLVIAEEFGQWEDARRRIDLLAIDRDARLTVIELKRTAEGGHMELQALRYAAMVSSMRFEEVASTYAAHVAKHRLEEEVDARAELLAWPVPSTVISPARTSRASSLIVPCHMPGGRCVTLGTWVWRLSSQPL